MASMWKYVGLILLSGLIGFFLGQMKAPQPPQPPDMATKELRKGSAGLINPLLECDPNLLNSPPKLKILKDKLTDLLSTKTKLNASDTFSIYYKDLNSGGWFGINSDLYFAAASLSKVPIMAEIFKIAETKPEILKKKIAFDPEKLNLKNIYDNLEPSERLEVGKSYTVMDLIKKMVQKSDNIATAVLIDSLDLKLSQLFSDFGITYEKIDGNISLTAKSYGAIFRILYNSTFLNESYSTKALEILTQSEFNQGIKNPIPGTIQVANKFGARNIDTTGYYQLHDCGIIYKPNRPYLLCIMTKGKKLDQLVQVIREISDSIYKSLEAEAF